MREEILKVLTEEDIKYCSDLGITLDSDLLDPKIDSVFKAIFTTDSEESRTALACFLSAVLGRKVTKVTIGNNEPAVNGLGDKQSVFDVHVRFEFEDEADIEMQMRITDDLEVRAEYNTARLFGAQAARGKNYGDMHEAVTIFVLNQTLFHDTENFFDKYVYTGMTGRILKGKTMIFFIELSKLAEILKKPVSEMTPVERWGVFYKYLTAPEKKEVVNEIISREEGIKMAAKVLEGLSRDEEERIRHYHRLKYEIDRESQLIYADKMGFKRGMDEGMEAGMAKGIIKTAKNALAMGLSLEQIEQFTGLSREEIVGKKG
ncbi:MAG: Rpn family recombination-promoting nuclease/putative transposase [Clostridiales bacterium]|nr:Rpn family recombination-promoting nuclease/putative transposase [Clostridiales bacterium]